MANTIQLDLASIKASGITFLEFDATQNIIVAPSTIRLIPGFSRKGPINTPTYITDLQSAKTVFGEIDENLERRGSFFHRSIQTALEQGPVYALNLLNLSNNVDDVGIPTASADVLPYRSFSTDTTDKNGFGEWDVPSPLPNTFPYNHPAFTGYLLKLKSSYYNKEKFWFPDTSYFLATRDSQDKVTNAGGRTIGGKILNFTNLGKSPVTIIVRKPNKSDVSGFNVTFKSWFGSGSIPSTLKNIVQETDWVSDYFIEVIIIQGNYGKSKYDGLSSDPIFRDYFTSQGLLTSQLTDLINKNLVPVVATFRGCIIPDFKDQNDVDQSIETIINRQFAKTGLFCAIDKGELDRIDAGTNKYFLDLVGHRMLDNSNFLVNNPEWDGNIDFLSYRTPFDENLFYTEYLKADVTSVSVDGYQTPSVLEFANTNFGFENGNVDLSNGTGTKDLFTITISENLEGQFAYAGFFNDLKTKMKVGSSYVVVDALLSSSLITPPVSIPKNAKLYCKVETITTTKIGLTNFLQIVVKNLTPFGTDHAAGQETWVQNSLYDIFGLDTTGNSKIMFWYDRNIFDVEGLSPQNYFAGIDSQFYKDFLNGIVSTDDTIYWGNSLVSGSYLNQKWYLKIEQETDPDFLDDYVKVTLWDNPIPKSATDPAQTQETAILFGQSYKKDSGNPTSSTSLELWGSPTNPTGDTQIDIVSSTGSFFSRVDAKKDPDPKIKNVVYVPDLSVWRDEIKVNNFLRCLNSDGKEILARIIRVKGRFELVSGSGIYYLRVETETPIVLYTQNPAASYSGYTLEYEIEVWKPIESMVQFYDLTYLSGFQLQEKHLPNNTEARLTEIYGVIDNTNIGRALASKEIIGFRYIVDTFNQGLAANSGAKLTLSKLAKSRGRALAFINSPSIAEFIDSTDPIFTDLPTATNPKPTIDTAFIATGGNLEQNPTELYSLPVLDQGASHTGFFSPNLIYKNGNKTTSVPPAANVSNLFVKKFRDGTPFVVVAGTQRGVLSGGVGNLIGLEYDYDETDRGNIEPFGFNPIIKQKNGTIIIFGNQTGFQTVGSALNNIHVRDMLITIEDDIETIVKPFLFAINNDSTRLQIKTAVDNYLANVQLQGGIESFDTQIDRVNNPEEITKQNIAILNVNVVPTSVVNKFIARITLEQAGGISTGGFVPV